MEAFLTLLNSTVGSVAAIAAALAAMVAAWHSWRNSKHIQAIHVALTAKSTPLRETSLDDEWNHKHPYQ